MVARSVWTMLASLPGAEVVALELMGVVAATLEVMTGKFGHVVWGRATH